MMEREKRQPTNFDLWVYRTVSPILIPVIQWLTKFVLWVGVRTKTLPSPEKEALTPPEEHFTLIISEVAKFGEKEWEIVRRRVFSNNIRKKIRGSYAERRIDEGDE